MNPNLKSLNWPGLPLAILVMIMTLGAAGAARAEVISISAASFVQHCPCPVGGTSGDVDSGTLVATDQATYYAAVDFPANGRKICSFSLIYQDTNNNDVLTARLLRKSLAVGSNAFSTPAVIAKVNSAVGVVETVRKETVTLLNAPTVNDTNAAYFVEIAVPTVNLNLLGVQIDHRPACP